MSNPIIRIAIADDEVLLLDLLGTYLQQSGRFEVVLTSANGNDFLDGLARLDGRLPDIALIDLRMEQMDGLALLKVLKERFALLPVIVMSSHYHDHSLSFMVKHGVAAFVPKGIAPQQLVQVLDEVHTHGFYLLPAQVSVIRRQIASPVTPPVLDRIPLTEREKEVLILLAQQKTAKEIAEALFVTARTVEGHKSNLFAKTGAKNLAGLVLFAIQHRLVDPDKIRI